MLFQNTIIFPATNVCERHRILRADAPLTMPSVVHLLPCVRPGSQPPGFSVRARCNVISTSLVSCHYSFLIDSFYSTSEKMSITFFQLFFLCQSHVSLMHSDVLQVPAILRRYHQPLQQSSCSPRCSQVLRLNVLSLPRLLPRLSGYYCLIRLCQRRYQSGQLLCQLMDILCPACNRLEAGCSLSRCDAL